MMNAPTQVRFRPVVRCCMSFPLSLSRFPHCSHYHNGRKAQKNTLKKKMFDSFCYENCTNSSSLLLTLFALWFVWGRHDDEWPANNRELSGCVRECLCMFVGCECRAGNGSTAGHCVSAVGLSLRVLSHLRCLVHFPSNHGVLHQILWFIWDGVKSHRNSDVDQTTELWATFMWQHDPDQMEEVNQKTHSIWFKGGDLLNSFIMIIPCTWQRAVWMLTKPNEKCSSVATSTPNHTKSTGL